MLPRSGPTDVLSSSSVSSEVEPDSLLVDRRDGGARKLTFLSASAKYVASETEPPLRIALATLR